MVRLEWTARACGDVTLVEAVVENTAAVARRVRVANRTDGAVRPPRRRGVPEAGWDDGGFEGVVGPGETLALGYAAEGCADGPPAEVAWTERAATEPSGEDSDDAVDVEASPEGVVRALGDPRPPADAVPVPEPGVDAGTDAALPDAVDAWLAAVEARSDDREADGGSGEGGERTAGDAAALRAAERRIRALRERIGEPADGARIDGDGGTA